MPDSQMFRHQISAVRLPLLLPAEQYSQPQEGRGAFGGRVLSFVGFAPNDGLSPQNGPVQRDLRMPPKTVSRQKEGPFMGRLRANFG